MFPGAFVADARICYKHEAIGLEATAADKADFHTFVFSEQARRWSEQNCQMSP